MASKRSKIDRMRRLATLLCALSTTCGTCAPEPVLAADLKYKPVCSAPSECVLPILRGEIAPFDGQLMTSLKAAKIAVESADIDKRIRLEVAHTSSIAAIDLRTEKAFHAADLRQLIAENGILERQLAAASPAWYERPVIVVPATVVLVLGAVFVGAKVLEAAKP